MTYAIAGLIIGILAGVYCPFYVPKEYSGIFSVALMAALDTGFGGIKASLEGLFDISIFVSGFTVNILLAAFFCYAGIMLGIDFYLVVMLVFGMRIFQNLAIIRRLYLKK